MFFAIVNYKGKGILLDTQYVCTFCKTELDLNLRIHTTECRTLHIYLNSVHFCILKKSLKQHRMH